MMALNENTVYFLKLIKQYCNSGGEDLSKPEFVEQADLEKILMLAVCNNCGLLLYHTIRDWGVACGLKSSTLQTFKEQMLISAILQVRADNELKEVLEELNQAGVKYLLLKGVILSAMYPDSSYRRSSDADIHVSDEYFEQAADVLTRRGYICIQKESIQYETTFELVGVLSIELHTRLFEAFYDKNRSAIAAAGLDLPSSRREIRVLDTVVETLSINHFFVYVICHHTKHFITSGITLRHLIDLRMYVNEYSNQLDWDYIISSMERFHIKDFVLNVLYICQHYLGMVDVSFLYDNIDEDIVTMLIYDIVERNSENDNILKRDSARDIVYEAYFNKGDKKNTFNTIIASYFPSRKVLSKTYAYVKEYPILLPIAWLQRSCSYIQRRITRQKILSPTERAKLATERVELLKRVGIL